MSGDLVVLVADSNMEAAICGLLSRRQSLGIRAVFSEVHVHPHRDPGCRQRAHDFLRPFVQSFAYTLVMFDREGCGSQDDAAALELQTEQQLSQSGWDRRARVIVIDPELEAWVWSNSPQVDHVLGWGERRQGLRDWLIAERRWDPVRPKPAEPKSALEAALRSSRTPRSSALYRRLAESVGLRRCRDRAFLRFRATMASWFGSDGTATELAS